MKYLIDKHLNRDDLTGCVVECPEGLEYASADRDFACQVLCHDTGLWVTRAKDYRALLARLV